MRIIVAGGRDFTNYDLLKDELGSFVDSINSRPTIISGGARGADQLGEKWATEYEYPIERFPAKWDLHGRGAGFIRNKEMADYSEALLAFWDGNSRGTKHMIDTATKCGLIVKVINY